jgi:hypothetical protein
MRSKLVGLSGDGMRRLARFAAQRPWLCGAAALAVATAGLFAWFCGQRWDRVDVSTVPESRLHADFTDTRFTDSAPPIRRANSAGTKPENPDRHATIANESAGMPASETLNGPGRIPFRSALRPPVVDVAAPAAAVPTKTSAARGAWLVGTIEEIDDEFRHAHGGRSWPGLASRPGPRSW